MSDLREEGPQRAPERSLRAVLHLESDAEPVARAAQEALGAALRNPSTQTHQLGVGRAVPTDELRTGPHRSRGARATPSRPSSRENACAMRSSVSAQVTTPHPSIAVGSEGGSTSAAPAISASIASWHGCDASR